MKADDVDAAATRAGWCVERARHWHLFSAPARPSAGELAIYAAAVNAPDEQRVALLGATPELRSLAAARGLCVTAYDRSADVFAMLRPADVSQEAERVVEGEWTDIADRNCYALVLADGSLNMVAKAQQPHVLERIAEMVCSGGRALMRVHLAEPPRYADATAVFEGCDGATWPVACFPRRAPSWTCSGWMMRAIASGSRMLPRHWIGYTRWAS